LSPHVAAPFALAAGLAELPAADAVAAAVADAVAVAVAVAVAIAGAVAVAVPVAGAVADAVAVSAAPDAAAPDAFVSPPGAGSSFEHPVAASAIIPVTASTCVHFITAATIATAPPLLLWLARACVPSSS
jgi:hypothetical protein